MDNIQKLFYVVALCAALLFFSAVASFGQNVIYSCDFEDNTENANWTLENGSHINQWYIGTAARNGGDNGLYITNDGGANNAYDNTATSYVYAYRTLNVDEDGYYTVSFDWQANGEGSYDYLRAFIVPASANPDLSAGTAIEGSTTVPDGWIDIANGELSMGGYEWHNSNNIVALDATTYHLVFYWKNSNSGNGYQPPAAVDNISITKVSCVAVTSITATDITGESATISWTERGSAENWEIVVSVTELDVTALENNENIVSVTSPSYSATSLTKRTTYYVYVRAVCSTDDKSDWQSATFSSAGLLTLYPDSRTSTSLNMKAKMFSIAASGRSITFSSGRVGGIINSYSNSASINGNILLNQKDGLSPETEYYYTVSASNAFGSYTSDTIRVTTCGTMTDERDGTQYNTIKIGEQVWMAENLRYEGSIPLSTSTNSTYSSTDPYRYYPTGGEEKVQAYGYLYNLPAAMNGASGSNANPSGVQGICPEGWHLPSKAEWDELENHLNSENAGAMLAGKYRLWGDDALTQSYYFGASGFDALPAGYVTEGNNYNGGNYENADGAYFWSSNVLNGGESAICTNVYSYAVYFRNNGSGQTASTGNSVRCVKSLSPTVATNWATGITTSSATLNAHINNLGDATVSVRGFMFGTDMDELTQNLTSSDNTTDFTYTIEDLSPSTIYYFKAYITIGAETIYGEIITFNTLAGLLAGHGYVDLGLPSGTYWATCNVGATTIEGLGNYYAWGETSPKPRYTSDNYTYDAYSDILPLSDDAAAVNWGDGWRMPTDEEMVELYDNCDYTFTIWNDTVRGLLLTSRINGNTIFLPAAGNGFEDYTTASQYECELFYWTSSIADYPQAYSLYYYRPYDNLSAETTFNRYQGLSVRAVFKDIPTVETKSATDVTPTTATLHGKILFTENATVTNRGFSFGTDSDDLTQDFTSTDNTDNFTYSLTDLTANTTYYFQAYATIDGDIMYGEIKSFTTPRETHDFVDLGLPSGNKWATCNVGASVPEGFGNYYGWGETYNKEIGDWPTYIYYNGSSFTKYTRSDGRTTLEAMDDAATVNWGDGWRMPTKDEVSELFNNCSSIWTTLNGVNGRLFTSNLNGNTIFLPAAGKVNEGGYENDGRSGTYWSSSFRTTSTNEGAWDYEVYPDVCELGSLGYRKYGRSVRAIYTLAPTVVTNNATYLTSTSATLNASITDNGNSAIIERGFKYGTDRNNLNEIVQSNDATSDFSVSLTGLAEGTLYYYCAYATNSDATDYAGIKSFMTPQNPATLPYTCGFEDATENDNWVLENGNQTNKWYIGTVVNNGGENGLYISNDGGISNTYSGTETRVYAYRDILVPDGTTDLLLSFDWKAKGGLRNYEFLRVYWLNPAVVTVTAGNNPPTINGVNYDLAGQPGSYGSFANSHWLSQQNTWQHEVMIISADQFTDMGNGDKIYRLYFHWRNINYSSQPPAAVDNVHLEQIINPIVATSSVSDISTTSATLHGSILSHGASDITVRGFEYGTDEENLTEIVQSTDGTNDFSVSLTNLASNTTYYYRAYATNSDDTGYGEIKMFTTNGIINDHEFVDLGLPSGTKWATCNVGASNPEDYGDYFAWGETTPKDTYTWETYIYAEGTSNNNPELTKYNNNAQYGNNGFTDNLTTLESTDDAATANWGAGWRMPTETEMRELIENCDITWTSTSGAGMVFTSRSNGNSIFLPAAGTYGVNGLRDLGSYGTYWPSSLYTNAPSDSWRFIFYSQNHLMDNDYRYEGLSVRAIYRLSPTVATNSADNITHTTATLHGSISNIGASEIIERGFEYGTDRENLTETVQCTDATNAFSVSLTNLASGTIYYYRAYATNSDDTGYGEILTFNTKICPDENMCGISYELADSYGDGWNGCAINVVDVETEIVIATLTIDNGSSATGTLEVCDGREIIFEWVEGEYPEETSYQIFDVNGDEIFSGSGAMYSPVSYTMSCSSCRVVADFTIADITTESATISFTGQGTATSWELIVSETELDDADLENYNNAIILTEPSYSATGLPIATQYYVYVRSVCPNDDKSSWKKGAFNTKICPDEDMCGISYELASEISIGWSGGAINIVDVESEIAIATLTINQGYSATGIVDVCDGKEIRIDYTAGQYPDFVSYHIFDANGDVIDSYYGLDSPTSHSQLYTVSCPTCRPVKNIRATEITTESATIRWADYGSAESWEIIVSDEEIDDNALDSNGAIVQSADSTYVATGLTSSTYYYVYVHALCLGSDESKWRSYSFTTPQIPAIIPYTCDFEDVTENTNWTLANGDQTNQWHIGSTANNGGENGLYISDDDGVSNEYDNHSTSDVYAYRTIDIDENAFYEISFDWRSNGRGTSYYSDFLDVFLAPVSSGFDLSGGNQPNYLTYDWIYLSENLLAEATSWQNFTKIINIDEGRYNLVFYWRNSSIDIDSGHPADNPPAAIDNISIKVNEVATIPYICDFEDADENANWILANENQTNQWYIGSAANNGGENGLYISDDDGTSNEYDINSPSVVYAYRTIDIEEDDIYEISFDWRSNGDGDTPSALLGVFLAPVSSDFNLVGGNDLDNLDDWIIITEEPLADATSWQNFTKIINIVEGSYNLIFYWANRNDGGENPPAAIDNISINSLTPDISVTYPMDRSTTGADIIINYSPFTDDENYTMLLHYGSNRNIIYQIVYANYNSTNEFYYAEITNLEPDTKYYYYAEARSEFGTFQSDTLWFYTLDEMIDDRDNHRYHTIRIGNQIWMAEDLNYAGNIPQGTLGETSSTEPYRYATEYCTEYSTKLYNWSAAMNLASSSNENPSGVQGVCPNGWHLPSEAEWQELYDTLGGNERDAGSQMIHSWINADPISESEYLWASGLDAYYSNWYSGSYEGNCENATFWSATANNTDEAYYHRIYSGSTDLLSGSSEKGYGFNVRCVKGSTYYTFDTIPYCGESYTFGTQTITESGDYTRIVNLGEDADSIYKLHITFFEKPVATISDFSNGCFGQNNGHATVSVEGGTAPYSYAWNTPEAHTGATLSNLAEGEYRVIVTDANGCSATSSVEITTPDEIAVSIADTACNSYEWNGTTYTETGEYTQTLQNAEGCDSVVTLRLTINHSSTGEFTDLMCAGVPYTYGGETFNEAGTYTVTLINSVGCDSVVTLTLTYADNCNGIISGVITDDYTGDLIPNARVTIGNNVTYTDAEGQYSLEVLRGRKTLRVSAVEYISHSEIIDVQGDTTINIALNSPRIITSDNISLTTYPYLEQTDTITITNTGNGTLVWSSITEYDGLALVEDSTIQRRNSRSLWDSIKTFTTRENAEQAVATDGFFIYTSSWMRPGEFNRYTPNGEYVETFFIENVGMIRNLSYNGNYFYGTDATNVIYKLDLDNQTLLGSIETDIPEIRHCSFNRPDGSILAGDWNSLYRIDTTSGTSEQIRSDLANVYSSAFDNLSSGGPYLWLFSQTSQDNGPSACIRQFDISANDFTDKIHYLDDIEISDASLAGGICASEYVCEGKFVLLTNVQNPSGNNTIATYEIGRTNSVARAERKSGTIAPNESENIAVRAFATETGEYASTIRYRAAVMGRQSNDVIVNISAIAPECDAVQQIAATTEYSAITLEWQPVELGEYNNVSYLVYNMASQSPIDTLSGTSVTYRGLPNGEHCFYVRALSSSSYTCLSEASNTVCAEIKDSPCDIPLFVEARSDGETITVSWNPLADIDNISIYRDGESIAENITTTKFIDTDVVAETDYCYTVVAHLESVSCNEISGETCMRILTGVCTEVPALTADALGNLVALKWTECDGAVNYRIFRDNEFVGTTTDISYTDNVHEAGNYCYVVESDCEHRMYKLSNEECVSADVIAEWSADNITLYPNPTYSQFFIEGQHIATIQIFNAIGQLVAEIENNESERITINCEDWNPGLYNVLLISTEGEMATRKVTIFR